MARMHKLREIGGRLLDLTVCNRLYPEESTFAQRSWTGVTCKACKKVRDAWRSLADSMKNNQRRQ